MKLSMDKSFPLFSPKNYENSCYTSDLEDRINSDESNTDALRQTNLKLKEELSSITSTPFICNGCI